MRSTLRVVVTHLWRWATHDPRDAQAEPGRVGANLTFSRTVESEADAKDDEARVT